MVPDGVVEVVAVLQVAAFHGLLALELELARGGVGVGEVDRVEIITPIDLLRRQRTVAVVNDLNLDRMDGPVVGDAVELEAARRALLCSGVLIGDTVSILCLGRDILGHGVGVGLAGILQRVVNLTKRDVAIGISLARRDGVASLIPHGVGEELGRGRIEVLVLESLLAAERQ